MINISDNRLWTFFTIGGRTCFIGCTVIILVLARSRFAIIPRIDATASIWHRAIYLAAGICIYSVTIRIRNISAIGIRIPTAEFLARGCLATDQIIILFRRSTGLSPCTIGRRTVIHNCAAVFFGIFARSG